MEPVVLALGFNHVTLRPNNLSSHLRAGQQVTRRRGLLRTWRCRTTWGSISPRRSTEWIWRIWSGRWRMIIFPTSATTAGRRNNKVCLPGKQIVLVYLFICLLFLPFCHYLSVLGKWLWSNTPHISFIRCLFDFLQRKGCFTEPAILETTICTREHRGLAHRAAPSCPRSRLHYMVEDAFLN